VTKTPDVSANTVTDFLHDLDSSRFGDAHARLCPKAREAVSKSAFVESKGGAFSPVFPLGRWSLTERGDYGKTLDNSDAPEGAVATHIVDVNNRANSPQAGNVKFEVVRLAGSWWVCSATPV